MFGLFQDQGRDGHPFLCVEGLSEGPRSFDGLGNSLHPLPWRFDGRVAPLPIQLFLQGHLVLLLPQTVDPAFFNCEGELVVPCLQLAEDVQFFRQASVHPGEPIEHFRRWSPRTPVHHRHRLFV